MKKFFLFASILIGMLACAPKPKEILSNKTTTEIKKPNIVIFYVDDLGYGDISCYGATSVATPYVDQLAKNGIQFTDAHSSASTCTPSRYSLLTGQYAFRNNAAILPGDAPLLIDIKLATLPRMLHNAGYQTAIVGKWHLGLGDGTIDWNKEVKPGPLEIGFDYSFLLPSTGDRVPTTYLENHNIINLDPNDPLLVSYKKPFVGVKTGITNPELLRFAADKQHSDAITNGVSRIGNQTGGKSAMWIDEEFPSVLYEKATQFIDKNKDNPFFLLFSFHDIHVPRLPNKQFQGKTTMGSRGDAIVQMDWMTGQVMKKLESLGLDKNTLIIFTSDNGPVLNDGYEDGAVEKLGNHKPGGVFKGGKYSSFEAGTRVPMITYWPGTIKAGVSDALISQIDYFASLGKLVNGTIAKGDAFDSEDHLNALLNANKPARKMLLEEGYTLAIRNNNFKYIAPISKKQVFPNWIKNKGVEGGVTLEPQLFNLSNDFGEQVDIALKNKDLVTKFQSQIDSIVAISKK